MRKVSFINSIFAKAAIALFLCIGAVAITLAVLNQSDSAKLGELTLKQRAGEVTGLLANLSGGSVKFSKTELLQSLLDDAKANSQKAMDYAIVIDASGNVIAGDKGAGTRTTELGALARAALQDEAPRHGAGVPIAAAPIYFGNGKTPIGAVATHWNTEAQRSFLVSHQRIALLIASAVFVLAMALGTTFLRVYISTPLRQFGRAITRITGGDYATEVPLRQRRDEMGCISTALDELRKRLDEGEAARLDANFKSAALEGSSAAMMLLDGDYIVRHMNPASRELLKKLAPAIRKALPDFDASNLVGRSLETFLKRQDGVQRRLFAGREESFEEVIPLGAFRIALRFSPARDAGGKLRGRVIEWADVTTQVMNSAILEAINSDQARAEFGIDGKLTFCNTRFAEALGEPVEALTSKALLDLLDPDWRAAEGRTSLLTRVAGENSVRERFEFRSTSHGKALIEAGLSCIRDPGGKPMKYLLLGRDITKEDAERQANRAERAEMQKRQSVVVDALKVALRKMREGDLNQRISTKFSAEYEELRADYNGTIDTLSTTLRELLESAHGIHGEARDISSTADALSRRTESTAATLEETAAALDQLTGSVKAAAEGAARADREVSEARKSAERSGEIVQETVQAMDQISTFSEKITSITKVIEDIAFQTNLLALNAGVEAARAGEAGRGFAVVASEVRALAQRCTEAAREINELIADSGSHVQRGVELVGHTGAALKEIVTSITGISGLVSEIAASAGQQSTGLAEINTAVNALDQSTQQNAARLEETTAASQSLTNDALVMVRTMSHFQLGGQDKKPLPNDLAGAKGDQPKARPAAQTPKATQPAPAGKPRAAAADTGSRPARPAAPAPVKKRAVAAGAAAPRPVSPPDDEGWSNY